MILEDFRFGISQLNNCTLPRGLDLEKNNQSIILARRTIRVVHYATVPSKLFVAEILSQYNTILTRLNCWSH